MQEVFHFHMHVFPRFKGDGFGLKYDKEKNFLSMERDELDEVASELRKHIN
ncbi:hypothetical protein KAR91_37605 [Candidatus Pacearchaeota archaeon]|nr:hypothetical protein [Candidatus Pacearchaeota archaeon]